MSTDRHHRAAVAQLARLRETNARFVAHDGIRIELLDCLSSRETRPGGVRLIRSLALAEQRGELQVVPLNRELVDRAIRMFEARPDKDWGLTDCISFVLMQQMEIYEAFTCDHHFAQAGFHALI